MISSLAPTPLIWTVMLLLAPIWIPVYGVDKILERSRKRRAAGNPPCTSPGRTAEDYFNRTFVHPKQRRSKRHMEAKRSVMQSPNLPFDILYLIIDFCQDDAPTLSACSLACHALMERARKYHPASVDATRERAYDLVSLLASPLCTFVHHATNLYVVHEPLWETTEAILAGVLAVDRRLSSLNLEIRRPVSPKLGLLLMQLSLSEVHLSFHPARGTEFVPLVSQGFILQVICSFRQLKYLTLNFMKSDGTFCSVGDIQVPDGVKLPPTLSSLKLVICDLAAIPLYIWFMQQKPLLSYHSLDLLCGMSQETFTRVMSAIEANDNVLDHLGLSALQFTRPSILVALVKFLDPRKDHILRKLKSIKLEYPGWGSPKLDREQRFLEIVSATACLCNGVDTLHEITLITPWRQLIGSMRKSLGTMVPPFVELELPEETKGRRVESEWGLNPTISNFIRNVDPVEIRNM